MITYNPVTKNGRFEINGFDGKRTVSAINEAGAKWKYLRKAYGKDMNGYRYNLHVAHLTVKVIRPTERMNG